MAQLLHAETTRSYKKLQTDQTLLLLCLWLLGRHRVGREKALSGRSRRRDGGAGASSLAVGLVVGLVVQLVGELVGELVVQRVARLVAELVVELVARLVVELVGRLLSRLVDEAVGSGIAAVLHADGELAGVQRLPNTVHVQAESEGVCGQANTSGVMSTVISWCNLPKYKLSKYSPVLTVKVVGSLHFPAAITNGVGQWGTNYIKVE